MSYEDQVCPCGGRKEINTMLCEGCEQTFADHPSMSAFKDKGAEVETRRHAAQTLLTLARNRKRPRGGK